MRISQNFNLLICCLILRIYFDFFSRSFLFPLAVLFLASFVAHIIFFLSHEILAGFLSNRGRNLIGSGFFPQMLLVFWSVTLSELVKICQMRYQWKDLFSLVLLITILVA